MPPFSRRTFLQTTTLALSATAATPNQIPIGLELYTISDQLNANLPGTLKAIANIGYKTVEWPRFATTASASELRRALDAVGLTCPSVHYTMFELMNGFDAAVAAAHTLGAHYLICSAPCPQDPSRVHLAQQPGPQQFFTAVNNVTLDDWHWNAEQLNRYGEQASKVGLQLGYHNHNVEFKRLGDTLPYDLLLRTTDPKLVVFEMDCGWVTVAGHSPVAIIQKHPGRIRLLHVKDFRPGFKPSTVQAAGIATPTELGRGSIHYQAILSAAKATGATHYFVEQEPPFKDMPALDAIKADYDYLHRLHA
jgi:sugar phosphate isomerase/epimerase